MSHHMAEPTNTPRIRDAADPASPVVIARPKPAIIAVKESSVIGFVSVRKSVEA